MFFQVIAEHLAATEDLDEASKMSEIKAAVLDPMAIVAPEENSDVYAVAMAEPEKAKRTTQATKEVW